MKTTDHFRGPTKMQINIMKTMKTQNRKIAERVAKDLFAQAERRVLNPKRVRIQLATLMGFIEESFTKEGFTDRIESILEKGEL